MDFPTEFPPGPRADNLPAVAEPFDMLPVKTRLAMFKAECLALDGAARALTVADQASLHEGVRLSTVAKGLWGGIEDARKGYVEAPNAFVKQVNNLAKAYQEPLKAVERLLDGKVLDYQTRQEMERRKAQEAANQEAARMQAELNAEAEAHGIEAPQVVAPVIPEPPATVRTEEGSAHLRRVWDFEIVDAAQVPREFCTPDQAAIRQAVKAGIREIPGVRVFEKTTLIKR